jgi:peptide/nickel transport system substrate-binding protein
LWRSRKLAWSVLLLAFVLIVAACGGDDDTGDEATTTAADAGATTAAPSDTTGASGTTAAAGDDYCAGGGEGNLIWTHEQEPPDLHLDDPANNLSTASWARQGLYDALYGITASTEYYPELLAEEAVMTDNGDGTFTATFVLRDGLVWSDGDDLTADDVLFSYEAAMATGPDTTPDDADTDPDPDSDFIYLLGDRTGISLITDFTVTSPTEFSITFSGFFGGWKELEVFGTDAVWPSHVFSDDPATAAAELNEALREMTLANGEVMPSSGPMTFDSWERGVALHFVRNENYNGSQSPDTVNKGLACVAGVDIQYVADTDAQVNSLKANEGHVIMTQPQQQFTELATDPNFTVNPQAGPVWEHWGMNVLNVHLAKPEVREALAYALNKQQVVETLYTPLFGDLLPTAGQGNAFWMSNQPAYEDHQGDAGYGTGDVEAAKALLEGAGYVLGADGIYEHPTDGRLSLRNGTTGGNQLRELQQQLIQAQMLEAGIEIVIENLPGGEYFSIPFGGDPTVWELTQFAWVGGPWPGGAAASFRSDSGNNPYGYASEEFDAKANECEGTVDETEAAACWNELDTYVTTLGPDGLGLVVLPLTQKPSFYAYSNTALEAGAISPDADSAGPMANLVDFKLAP